MPLTKLPHPNLSPLGSCRKGPVHGKSVPSLFRTPWRNISGRLEVLGHGPIPTPAPLPLGRELILLPPSRGDQVDNLLNRDTECSREHTCLDAILSASIVLAGDLNLASEPIGTVAGHHVDTDGAGSGDLQEHAPVVGRWVVFLVALILLVFLCGELDLRDLLGEVIAAELVGVPVAIHCRVSYAVWGWGGGLCETEQQGG